MTESVTASPHVCQGPGWLRPGSRSRQLCRHAAEPPNPSGSFGKGAAAASGSPGLPSSQRVWGRRLCWDEPSLLHSSHKVWGPS